MKVTQTHLMRKTEQGTEVHTICWLDVRPNVRVGSRVSLEDSPNEWWTVLSQGGLQDSSEINRKWGLDLPKTQRLER
jgi:hypothetical protein